MAVRSTAKSTEKTIAKTSAETTTAKTLAKKPAVATPAHSVLPVVSKEAARRLWVRAQRLDQVAPFGAGPSAVLAAVKQLGYVQIDTIHVIERCHHHILYNRVPSYRRQDLQQLQSRDKSVFEYWTHALSYVPTDDLRFYLGEMKHMIKNHSAWWNSVKPTAMNRILRLIRSKGPISIREIEDDVPVEKNHPWASRKPSKKVLEFGFYTGRLVVSERHGMLKKYELADRHFNWDQAPKPASDSEILNYLLDRGLRSQNIVSLDSLCHLSAQTKTPMLELINKRVRQKELVEVQIQDFPKARHWLPAELVDVVIKTEVPTTHLLSPFDPLVIQRKRLHALFDYQHRFEAYLPKEKRKFGYFALPVLHNDKIIAAIDLKTDRQAKKLLLQKWTWIGKNKSPTHKRFIEEELGCFERFQLGPTP